MPRANRRRKDEPRDDLSRLDGLVTATEWFAGEPWSVRSVRGRQEGRSYTCPGCRQQLLSATPHVVVWPQAGRLRDDGPEHRRHWHSTCWRARDRRLPGGSWK